MSKIVIRKRWRILARSGAVLLLGFFLLLISLPNLIDLDNYRPQLLTLLQSRLAGEVAVGKLGLTFHHGPGLRVDGVRIFDKSGSQHIMVATAIINFDLSSLFRQHLLLSRLTLVRADIKLQLNKVESPLADFINPVMSAATKPEGKSFKFAGWSVDDEISGALVEIVDSSIEFTDNCFGTTAIKTHLEKFDSTFLWQKSNNLTEFELAARVIDGAGNGSLAIKGTLSNLKFPLAPGRMILDCKIDAENLNGGTYFPYYQEYVPMRFIGGRVDIDANYSGSLLGLFRSKGQIVLHQAVLDYQQVFRQKLKFNRFAVDYDFRLADSYNTIETRDCTINADGLVVQGYCLLYEARRGIDGTIDAKLNSLKFNPVKLMPVLPWGIIPDEVEQYCNHVQDQGSLVVENAYLKGDYRKITRLLDEQPPVGIIGGHIRGENLAFSAVNNWPSLTLTNIDFMLADNLVKMNNVNLSLGDIFTCDSGKLSLQNIFHEVQVGFSGYIGFDLQKLNPYIDRLFFKTAKSGGSTESPFILNSGSFAGELALQGPLLQPEKMHWGGNFTGRDIGFTIAGLPWAVEHGKGSFALIDNDLRVESASLEVASVPWELHGTLPGPGFFLKKNNPAATGLDLKARCAGFTPAYLNLLSQKVYNISGLRTEDSSFLEIALKSKAGDFSDFAMAGTLNLDWHDVECSFTNRPLKTLNCVAEFDPGGISCERLYLQNGKSEFTFRGDLSHESEGAGYMITGEISSPYLAVDDFAIIEQKMETDLVELDFAVTGVVDELVLPAFASREKPVPASPWQNLYDLHLSLAGGIDVPISINECRWQWGAERAEVNITGGLQVDDGLHGDLEIAVSDLDIDNLLALPRNPVVTGDNAATDKEVPQPIKAVVLDDIAKVIVDDKVAALMSLKKVLQRNELNLTVRADRLLCLKMVLDEVECECSVKSSGVNIEKLVGTSFEGDFNVSAGWCFADDSFMVESQLEDISFETLNDYLNNPDRGLPVMGGHGSLNLDLYWHGNTLRSWEESLDGDLDFDFFDGRLKRFSMIANICSILNFSQYASLHLPKISISNGVPYRELTYRGLIVNGLLEFDEFEMVGPSFNLFGSGEIDMVNDTVDLKIGIQPLQTVGKVLASIPVLGYIMTGDEKTFVVIPVTVRGPFDDIKIKTRAVAGMGKNVAGMLQRFFKTPIRILQIPGKLFNMMGAEKQPDVGAENSEKSEAD